MTDLHTLRAEAAAAFRKLEWFDFAQSVEQDRDVVAMNDDLQRNLRWYLGLYFEDATSRARLRVAADALDRLARCLRQTGDAA